MMQKSYKIPLITSCLGISLALLFTYLTFIPEQTFAINGKKTLSDISKMEELTPWICYNSENEESNLLEDTRINKDGKTRFYWVTKLADGNCWMTQNLDYDLPDGASTAITAWPRNGDSVNYFDPQHYIYKLGSTAGKPTGQNGDCSSDGVTSFNCSSQFEVINYDTAVTNKNVKLHYHVGNYYSWEAAVNNSGVSISRDGDDAENSICPNENWRLPTSDKGNLTTGSFQNFQNAYSDIVFPSTSATFYSNPVYFVWGGYLVLGRFYYAGDNGRYWTSTAANSERAYALTVSTIIEPASSNMRYAGFSVRCLVLADDTEPEPEIPPAKGTANISVTVSPVISLDVATSSTSDKMTAEFTKVSTSEIITNVSSNYQYTVGISTEQTKLLPSDSEGNPITDSLNYIPMIESDQDIVAGNISNVSAWGIKKKLSAIDDKNLSSIDDNDVYSPVGTTNPEVFYKSATSEALTEDKALVFKVGVGVDAKLPSGRYSTTVTLTASVI